MGFQTRYLSSGVGLFEAQRSRGLLFRSTFVSVGSSSHHPWMTFKPPAQDLAPTFIELAEPALSVPSFLFTTGLGGG